MDKYVLLSKLLTENNLDKHSIAPEGPGKIQSQLPSAEANFIRHLGLVFLPLCFMLSDPPLTPGITSKDTSRTQALVSDSTFGQCLSSGNYKKKKEKRNTLDWVDQSRVFSPYISEGWEIQDQGAGRLVSGKSPLPSSQRADSSCVLAWWKKWSLFHKKHGSLMI